MGRLALRGEGRQAPGDYRQQIQCWERARSRRVPPRRAPTPLPRRPCLGRQGAGSTKRASLVLATTDGPCLLPHPVLGPAAQELVVEPNRRQRSGRGVTTTSEATVADPEPACTFEAFYSERYRDAVRLAFVMTGDADSAEDVAQDALMRVRPRFDALREPWPYTRATIINTSRTHLRRRGRERTRLALVAAEAPVSATLQASELLDAIDRLPFRQKVVIVLRYYEDLSEREIAEALRCRPGTVKSLASRALSTLSQEYQR